MKVLIVDDDQSVRETIKEILLERGLPTIQARTLTEGVRSFLQYPEIICAIVEVHLEDGSGLRLVEIIKETKPQLKIIVISADTDREREALQTGADKFMRKPFDPHHFFEPLKEWGLAK